MKQHSDFGVLKTWCLGIGGRGGNFLGVKPRGGKPEDIWGSLSGVKKNPDLGGS